MNEPQFTASHGRKFALTLAIAFGVIAAIAFWRGRQTASWIAGTIALVMSLAGLLVPGSLEPVERGWMKLAHAISRVTTPIFMGIVYFVILTPVGVVRRIMGANALPIFFGMTFLLGLAGANFAMYTLWLPELFETSSRGSGMGFISSIGRFVGVGMVFLIAAGVNHFGNIGTPIALTSIVLFAGLFLLPFTVETRGQPLPR